MFWKFWMAILVCLGTACKSRNYRFQGMFAGRQPSIFSSGFRNLKNVLQQLQGARRSDVCSCFGSFGFDNAPPCVMSKHRSLGFHAVHVYVYVYIHRHRHLRVCTCLQALCICMCIHVCAYTSVSMYTSVYICMHLLMYTYI